MNRKNISLRRQPQQKRSQERVEKILDAAATVFNEVGFEAATTHTIAAKANTAVGSLYQFFPDKLAIFNALELRHVDRVYVMWEKLMRPEIVQLPFVDFIHTLVALVEELFTDPTSRIVFSQFFLSPKIFKNIDVGFTNEVIQFAATLFRMRNPALTEERSLIIAEVAVNSSNTLILIALRSDKAHSRAIIVEIKDLLKTYLKNDLGDEIVKSNSFSSLDAVSEKYRLNSRQTLILKYSSHSSKITIQNCEAMFPNVSRRTLQRDLKVMQEKEILLPQGHTDNRSYQFNQDSINL